MKLTKMIASVLTGSLCLSVFCCGCTNTREAEETKDNKPVVDELPEDEVLIRSSHKNGAWGYYSSVTYVFSDGNVYSSSESFEGYYAYGQNNLTEEDRIALLKKYTKPRAYIDENQLLKIYQQAMQIDPDAEFVYEDLNACDAGTSVIEVNVDGEWITLSESGDQNGALDDRHAKKANALIEGVFNTTDWNTEASVYSGNETFLETFECPNARLDNARRLITSEKELRQFEKDTGIKLSEMEEFEYFTDSSYAPYSYLCIGVEIIQYDNYLSLEDVSADAFIVSPDYTGFALVEDPRIDISDEIVEQKTYCYVVILPGYDLSVYEDFLHH